eukprot:scaffold10053_cov52-Phaeocystis_antarctica.AAC.1
MLESLATILAVEQVLHIPLATGLPGLIVLDARGGRQLQPSEEDLVVVGGARVAGAQRAGTGSCGSRQANQIEHCRRRCLRRCQHLQSRHITFITWLKQVPVGLGRRHPTQIGALVEQQLHHLRAAFVARRQQRVRAVPLVVPVDRRALLARLQQRGAAVRELLVDRRALVEQQLRHLRAAPLACQHQRGPAVLDLLVDRRALVDQQLHHLHMALPARKRQRGVARLVLLVDRRAIVEQLLHQIRVAGPARTVEWAH